MLLRVIGLSICACLAAMGLAACGDSSGAGASSSEIVAQVGNHAITRGMLGQWMTEKIGEDFYGAATHVVRPRLISEPADYPACVATLKMITPIPGQGIPQPQPTVAQLNSKCRELYQGIKEQALSYLVNSYTNIDIAAAHGIQVSDEETKQELKRIRAEQYPTEAQFQQLLATRRRALSQELFIVKMDLIQQKLGNILASDNTKQATAFVREAKSVSATAVCRPGYIVEYCKGYTKPTNHPRPAVVLLEEIARWRPETSHGFTGVPIP